MACCPLITFKAAAHCDSFGLPPLVGPVLPLLMTLQGCWVVYIQLFPLVFTHYGCLDYQGIEYLF